MKILCKYNILLATVIAIAACGTSCSETDMSNKAERNAIKRGNERFKEKKYPEAATEYDNALKANAASEAAVYNKAMANLYDQKSDSAALTQARKNLSRLASNGTDAAISERALYNLGNDAVYIGDAIKAAAEQEQSPEAKQQMTQESTKHYKQAIENYKEILRRRPNNITALQNLRIAQLKLPPEEQGGGNDQQNQQQQQQQQQEPPKQNQNDQQILQSIQNKENATRRKAQPVQQGSRTTDKPW